MVVGWRHHRWRAKLPAGERVLRRCGPASAAATQAAAAGVHGEAPAAWRAAEAAFKFWFAVTVSAAKSSIISASAVSCMMVRVPLVSSRDQVRSIIAVLIAALVTVIITAPSAAGVEKPTGAIIQTTAVRC